MSQAVLISIRPEWCERIASGQKTIEVRKTKPSAILPLKCYIYCTKPSFPHEDFLVFDAGTNKVKAFYGGGKVIGEFVCHNIFPLSFYASDVSFFDTEPPMGVPGTCLTDKEIVEYLGNGKTGYGWLISDLVIYDKPKELGEFMRKPCDFAASCGVCVHAVREDIGGFSGVPVDCDLTVKRPPQSWCYVEELEDE